MAKNHTELTQKRLSAISEIIEKNGFTKKRLVINEIREGESKEITELFSHISDRTLTDLINFKSQTEILDDGHVITGRSVLKDSEGRRVMEWVKTSTDKQSTVKMLQNAIDELKKDIEPYTPIPEPKYTTHFSQLCNQYTITDYHLGMMTWAEETGDEWNMEIAENLLIKWFEQAIATSPNAEQAIFANIGDFLHWDGLEPITPTSGHILDADTRFQHLVRVSIRVIRKVIQMLLMKYKRVHLIMAEGNHDLASSAWLREVFAMFFENEPRLTVDNNPDPYYCFMWGETALFYHHSHKKNLKALDSAFVSKFKREFGISNKAYGHTGHYHHTVMLESSLMIMEQHPTLAGKDAHASRGAYNSSRNAKVITYHKKFGEVGRLTICPDMVKE